MWRWHAWIKYFTYFTHRYICLENKIKYRFWTVHHTTHCTSICGQKTESSVLWFIHSLTVSIQLHSSSESVFKYIIRMHWTSHRTYSILHQAPSASGTLWKWRWVALSCDYVWAFHLLPPAHWGPLSCLINLFPASAVRTHSWGSKGLSRPFQSLRLAFF